MTSRATTTARASRPIFGGLPIFDLSLRAFSGGKAVRVVALFALVPVLFAGIYWLDPAGTTARTFMNDLFIELIAPTILPLAILTLATNALGNEIEDRTMVYLVLKPIPRWRIIMEKFLAVAAAATLLLWLGTALTWLVTMRGEAGDNLEMLLALEAGVLAAVLGYGSLFLAVSLLVPRALLAGIIYSLLWETTIARFIPGVRLVSVRHYVVSIYGRLLDDPAFLIEDAMRLGPSLIVIGALTVVTLALASWRLATMNLE